MHPRIRPIAPLLLLLGVSSSEVRAQSDVVPPTEEATVFEDQTTVNGGGPVDVCIGNLGTTTTTRRAFVRYVLPAVPAGATVVRVVLELQQTRVRTIGGPLTATLEIRAVTSDWQEGTGAGINPGPCGGGSNVAGVDWGTQPGVASSPSASAALPSTDGVTITIDTDAGTANDGLIADVQAWRDNGALDRGWRWAVSSAGEATINNARSLLPGNLTIFYATPPVDLVFADGFE